MQRLMNSQTTFSKFIWHFIKRQKVSFIIMQFLLLAWAIKNTAWPYLFKLFIDKTTTHPPIKDNIWSDFAPILLSWVAFWLLIEIMNRGHGIVSSKLYPKLEADMRMLLFSSISNRPHSFFVTHLAGSISNNINDIISSATNIITILTTTFIPVSLAIIVSFGIFSSINDSFAVILAIWIVLHFGICFSNIKKCIDMADKHAHSRSQLVGNIVDVTNNIINVKLFSKKQYEYENILLSQKDEQKKHTAVQMGSEKIKVMLGTLSFFFLGIFMTCCVLHYWQKNILSVGDVVLIFSITGNIQFLTWIAGQELPKLFKELGICQQALSAINPELTVYAKDNLETFTIKTGEIKFEDVTFCYEKGGVKLFDNLSVCISGGSKVGLVGFSGSGKSSFINLLTRVIDSDAGKIYIDGIDINNVSVDDLRRQIAVIPQEPVLFHRNIMDNIKYGNTEATEESVISAAKLAHCHDFICQFPQGYNTLVGERGIKLSGGERQRIAIARAILKDAPILVLDEATSALDSVTEKHIHESLYFLAKSRTIVIISHRISTLKHIDRIIFFKNGKIVEDGSTEDLLNLKDGNYASLFRLQSNRVNSRVKCKTPIK